MSANDTLDPIDAKYLEQLSKSILLRNARGEWVDAPIVSTDFSQPMLNSAELITPGEIIIDAKLANDSGWNALRLTAPVSCNFDGFSRDATIDVPFRFDQSPAIRRIVFTDKSTFEIWFTEMVDSSAPDAAFHFSSNGVELKCTSSWEDHDPGTRNTLFVSCIDAIPETLDVELVDGSITAGDVPVRSVDGEKFAERLKLSSLAVDEAGHRVWLPHAR